MKASEMARVEATKTAVEQWIGDTLRRLQPCTTERLYKAISYALSSGGKRVRPVLMLLSADVFGIPRENVLPMAVALECIHTYSLIHDDLPAMDNDEFRRGQPTVHVKFGEAIAVLAGDALLNIAHTELFNAIKENKITVEAAEFISGMAGIDGMITGQAEDIGLTPATTKEKVLSMYSKKTAALMKAALFAPYLCLPKEKQSEDKFYALWQIGEGAGLVFQLKDDLLEEPNPDEPNFVTMFGRDAALAEIEKSENLLKSGINALNIASSCLSEYIFHLSKRMN